MASDTRAERRRMDRYIDKTVRPGIRKNGWMIQAVTPDAEEGIPDFAYTVGLTPAGLPEILIYGIALAWILNHAARAALKDPTYLLDGMTLHDLAAVPIKVVACDHTAPIAVARRLYGAAVPAVQLVWPDMNGNWPWDPDFHQDNYTNVPVHGTPPKENLQ